jgi:hypothetical protein
MKYNMLKLILIIFSVITILAFVHNSYAKSNQKDRISSIHVGFLYHNGVDIVDYSVEHKLKSRLYYFYTFGFPSLAATGISYYRDYHHNGIVGTIGVGIGSVAYSSILYQLQLAAKHYIKMGVGYTAGVAYTGIYPAVSYEMRFK